MGVIANHHKGIKPELKKTQVILSLARYYPASNMLWDQTKDLPKDRFKVVENIYAEAGCPIEVRLHLANFVESSFMTNEQVDERTAIGLAKQLIIELDAKIDALNDPDRVLDKRKLHELSDNLKVSSISSFLSAKY